MKDIGIWISIATLCFSLIELLLIRHWAMNAVVAICSLATTVVFLLSIGSFGNPVAEVINYVVIMIWSITTATTMSRLFKCCNAVQ